MSSDAGNPDDSDVISAEIVEDWVEANNRRTAIEFLRSTTAVSYTHLTLPTILRV